MHVLNVNSSLDFKTGGGTAERTFQMSRFLAIEGAKCTVLTIDTGLDETRITALKPAEVVAIPLLLRRFYIPIIVWKTIRKLVDDADIVHLMGHWSVLNVLVYIALRRARKPYVVCPAGALPIFGRSKWLKRLYNFIVGRKIIRNASGWIAVTAAEFSHFESYGIPASQVTVIPNGICKEDFPLVDISAFRRSKGLSDKPIILFMGRLNPIKGPDLLLRAFALVHDRIPDYQLVFAGPDEGMQSDLVDIAKQEGISDRVHFLGFVSGDDKSAAYHMASLLVVPSRQEAMSIVALEAGICGTPVLLTDQCGFSEIKTIDPGLEVPANPAGLADGLIQLIAKPDKLEKVSFAFEKFVSERYSWNFIVERYLSLYRDLLGKSSANKLSYLFPAAFMANTFAMTALLIVLGLAGNTSLAADVGIVQGATLAMFYAFSANARNLILNQASPVSVQSVMMARLFLMLPLAGAAYWLSVRLAGVESFLAIVLILRRCVEWLDEVFLSEMERLDARKIPQSYLISQSVLLLFALSWTLGKMPFSLLGLFLWALLPLLLSARFYWNIITPLSKVSRGVLKKILPHLGSTVIIGVTVYVFRLLIILIVGKNTAGDLFTAFAIGGVLGSVLANALGPSLVLHQKRNTTRKLPSLLLAALYASLIGGVVLFIVSVFELGILDWTSKKPLFWQATGLSMIGGVVMVYAQIIRHRLLQHHEDQDLFGPDVLMNILIIVSVPFLSDLFGMQALATLYLLSSSLALIFYWSYQKREHLNEHRSIRAQERIGILIAVMLIFPLFFQMSGGIFRDPSMYFNSGGVLRSLPIPLSVIACYGGIVMIAGYRRASVSLSYIFFTCLLMVGTTVAVSQGINAKEQAKFILLIQFILPTFGFVLGQIYEPKNKPESVSMEKAFLYTLAVVVPLQLLCTWLQGYKVLSPYLYLFSIYQHLQYVPVIFVSAFLIAFCRLWQLPKSRKILLILAPLMGIYVVASMSMLAILMLLAGLLGFTIYQWKQFSDKIPALLLLVVALTAWGCLQYQKDVISQKFTFLSEAKQPEVNQPVGLANIKEIAPNVSERFHYWKYYVENITSSPKTFLIGHVEPPDRSQHPSAHNYYLDFIYNFGVLALLPLLVVFVRMLTMFYRSYQEIYASPGLLSLSATVTFLLLVDNSFKVGLRQPYSGIFIFFLWGVLFSRLLILVNKERVNDFNEKLAKSNS